MSCCKAGRRRLCRTSARQAAAIAAPAAQRELDATIAGFSRNAAYQIAEIYAWRGEPDKAFEWLERAYVQNDGGLTFIKADPLMKSLQSDQRFAAFLRKLGLPE